MLTSDFFISPLIDLIPVHSVSPLLLPRQQLHLSNSLPHHCLLRLDVPCPDVKTSLLWFLLHLPGGCKSQLCKSACSVPEAPDVPTKRPQVATSKSTWFLFSSQLHLAPVVQLLALSGTTSPSWDRTPLWHGFGSSLWRKSLLLPLVPLY